jgi:sarcosine oxidase
MAVYDVIILGLGAMGSAAAHHLARRGLRVLGLEQFTPAHDRGASHGRSRIIREAYFEDPAYVPLIQRAYALWGDLQAQTGTPLLVTTGGLMIGPRKGALVSGALTSAARHGLVYELLGPDDLRHRYPLFRPPEDAVAVWEPRAGILFPEACVRAHLGAAARHGADLHFEERVGRWDTFGRGVTIRTNRGRYEAPRLVVTAGPWAGQILADLGLPLEVERNVMYWFHPLRNADAFGPERFPIYILEYTPGAFVYGFPALGDEGIKIAHHHSGERCTPASIRREVSAEEIARMRGLLSRYLPDGDGVLRQAVTCMYTNTPDGHFIIGRHPKLPAVTLACGFSGHGFKFAPVVGEILADLATEGGTRHNIDLFRLGRFE